MKSGAEHLQKAREETAALEAAAKVPSKFTCGLAPTQQWQHCSTGTVYFSIATEEEDLAVQEW